MPQKLYGVSYIIVLFTGTGGGIPGNKVDLPRAALSAYCWSATEKSTL